METEKLDLLFDTLYENDKHQDSNLYAKYISAIEDQEEPVLASLIERCRSEEVSNFTIQEKWKEKVTSAVDSIAHVNPFLPVWEQGQEVSALEAVSWVEGSRLDCRPKVFDGNSKSYKLCDSGSMVTVIKKSSEDKLDNSRYLQAVNGSAIKCYGSKIIEVRLGRKTYSVKAVIADVKQDILGWDFLGKYRLNWEWSPFGDLYLVDKKANIKTEVKFVTIPAGSSRFTTMEADSFRSDAVSSAVTEFEVASM